MCRTVPGSSAESSRKLDHHLHAKRPLGVLVTFRQSEMRINLTSHRTDWTVANNRKRRVNIHARHEAIARRAIERDALIREANSGNGIALNKGLGNRHARPDLHQPGARDLLADPLVELSEREDHAIVLVHELRE